VNLPHITPLEVGVFGAAIAVFYVGPAVLAWSDVRRQRRRERERVALEAAAAAVSVSPVDQPFPAAGEVEAVAFEGQAEVLLPVPGEEEVTPIEQPLDDTGAREEATIDVGTEVRATPPLHIVRLCEVRQVQLADWPPPEVRDDPVRRQSWLEGERLAATDMALFGTVPLDTSKPVASACLASTSTEGTHRIYRYFLFSDLWPAAAADAVAEAEFQLDPTTGTATGWVLPPPTR
jgi:hypothetical protein